MFIINTKSVITDGLRADAKETKSASRVQLIIFFCEIKKTTCGIGNCSHKSRPLCVKIYTVFNLTQLNSRFAIGYLLTPIWMVPETQSEPPPQAEEVKSIVFVHC